MIKKYIFCLMLLFSLSNSFGQIQILDENYGFKTIKFDTKLNNFNNIEFIKETENILYYYYNSAESYLYQLFDDRIDKIELVFSKSEKTLIGVILIKYYTNKPIQWFTSIPYQVMEIVSKFEKTIGSPNINKENLELDLLEFKYAEWQSEKVILKVGCGKMPRIKILNDGTSILENYSISTEFYKKEFEILNRGF